MIEIFVHNAISGDEVASMEIATTSTILQLKHAIRAQAEPPIDIESMRLFLQDGGDGGGGGGGGVGGGGGGGGGVGGGGGGGGGVGNLDDNLTISYYGIEDGDTLLLVIVTPLVWGGDKKYLYEQVKAGTVTNANFVECALTDNEAAMLSDASPTLTTLFLGSNQIGDEGATRLAENTTLTTLNLYSNQIGDEGATRLAANTTLTTLWLSGNQIGEPKKAELRAAMGDRLNSI